MISWHNKRQEQCHQKIGALPSALLRDVEEALKAALDLD
jgi:hypothetical protein